MDNKNNTDVTAENKKSRFDKMIGLITIIMLGVTALLIAWTSWMSSLHGGNQATNYATSNNLASEGNSEYNAGVLQMNEDIILWNDITSLQIEILFARDNGDDKTLAKLCSQIYYKLNDSISDTMAAKIDWDSDNTDSNDIQATVLEWLNKENSITSPFYDDDYIAGYFTGANELLTQAQDYLKQGQADNANCDAFGLVTVIYNVVLFLLGIAGYLNHKAYKYAIIAIALVAFVAATVYMFTLPMPTGFTLAKFFGG